nr:hypothetical protein CFP56_75192 [Quercus suber]
MPVLGQTDDSEVEREDLVSVRHHKEELDASLRLYDATAARYSGRRPAHNKKGRSAKKTGTLCPELHLIIHWDYSEGMQ